MSSAIETALVRYVEALDNALAATQIANDRPLLIQHLAAAAGLFLELHRNNLESLERRVEEERRSFGLSFLAGEPGGAVEEAFHDFAQIVDAR